MQSDSDTVGSVLVTALGMSPLLAERKRQPPDPLLCPAGSLDVAEIVVPSLSPPDLSRLSDSVDFRRFFPSSFSS